MYNYGFRVLRVANAITVESIIFQFDFQGNVSDRMYNRNGLKTGLFVLMVYRAKIAIEADRHALVHYPQGYISKPIYITYTFLFYELRECIIQTSQTYEYLSNQFFAFTLILFSYTRKCNGEYLLNLNP